MNFIRPISTAGFVAHNIKKKQQILCLTFDSIISHLMALFINTVIICITVSLRSFE